MSNTTQESLSPLAAYCRACGKQLDPRAVICPDCGVPQGPSGTAVVATGPSRKEPGLAILFSFFFAGAGELYAGDSSGKTIALLVVATIAWLCAFTVVLIPVSFLCIPVFIYSMVNSSRLVKEYNGRNNLL
jgi:TM2 domain-containing membrane protein YozV